MLKLTLEEMFYGVTKNLKLTRTVIRGGSEQHLETLTISVKPGWKKGTKITFPEKGDEAPGVIAADIVFVVDEKKHPQFERDGNDLVKTVVVDLHEALLGTSVFVHPRRGRASAWTCPMSLIPSTSRYSWGRGCRSRSPRTPRGT